MKRARSFLRDEGGQGLILAAFAMLVILGFAAMVFDVGLMFVERRKLQNATDAAALAAAGDLLNGESEATAIATAEDYLNRHGFSNPGAGIQINIPPLSGPYAGDSDYVEVAASSDAPTAFLHLFRADPYTVNARAVAEGRALADPGGPPLPVPIPPDPDCAGSPTVDGRVTESDGYIQIADLVGGSTDYGDAFFGCDGTYFYLAMRLNALSADGVANENVYGPKVKSGDPPGYNEVYQTGWDKHDFGALKNSDRARFQLSCDDEARHDFVQDYLREDGGEWASDAAGDGEVIVAGPAASASSLEWNLEHPVETGWGDDPGEVPFVPGDKKQGQSPPFDPLYPDYDDTEYEGWVWEMIYEFKVPMATYDDCSGPVYFGLNDFGGQTGPLEGLHSSPAKEDEGVTVVLDPGKVRLVE